MNDEVRETMAVPAVALAKTAMATYVKITEWTPMESPL